MHRGGLLLTIGIVLVSTTDISKQQCSLLTTICYYLLVDSYFIFLYTTTTTNPPPPIIISQSHHKTHTHTHRVHQLSMQRHHYQPPNSFSMLFTMPPPNYHHHHHQHHDDICPYDSSVDCTLSLATPAAAGGGGAGEDYELPESRSSSRFCWDFLQPENTQLTTVAPASSHRSNRGGGGGAGESLVARRCANCDTTSTPLWRNGPRGPKSLCNACGIRYKKEERRTAATAVGGGGGGDVTAAEGYSSWMHKLPSSCYSPAGEYRVRDDVDDRDSRFLSWRLNVTDRPAAGLLHDFTRY